MILRSLLLLTGLAAIAACGQAAPSQPETPRVVPSGTWATARALFTVEAGSAHLELDCAYADVAGALTLDDAGRFDVAGTYVREHGGPLVQGEPLDSHPARVTGRLVGRVLTLTISPTDGIEGPGTYELTFGAEAQLVKCR